jgi:hypothetical protein
MCFIQFVTDAAETGEREMCPELASYLRIEARGLEAGGRN